ncbi:MAG: right-handed parallel beta-helix repeat-containing protein [Candidatus Cloacimonetes bacterium]|nr:right-handed parallel beta-helix repeat-containing protein [Candidatus Cloacimonadota bacterium]
MKTLFILFMALPGILMATVWTVNWEGDADFTSIQPAINTAASNDTILVYPGEYFENLVVSYKSLTLLGTQLTSGKYFQAEHVIIHGDQSASTVYVNNSDEFTINGFVIMNNYPDNSLIYSEEFNYVRGGGLAFRYDCDEVVIRNCVIKNCLAWVGGGIFAETENINLSNVEIYNNRALHFAGGVYLRNMSSQSHVTFDPIHRCSIYCNTSSWVQDIFLSQYTGIIYVPLLLFSVPEIYAEEYYCLASSEEACSIELQIYGCVYEPVAHDLWVGIYGSDDNSGSSITDALKTLAWANQLIRSDPQERYTVHVTGGLYSFSENLQKFPFEMKSNVRMQGEGIVQTYIDEEGIGGFLAARNKENIKLSDFNVTGCSENSDYCIMLSHIDNLEITDLWLHNNVAHYDNLCASGSGNILLENLLIEESSTSTEWNRALFVGRTDPGTVLNNIIVNDFNLLDNVCFQTGILLSGTDGVMRNSILSNCSARNGVFFSYRNWDPADSTHTLELSNFLMYNNNCAYSSSYSIMELDNAYTPLKVYNCTFTNNYNGYSSFADCLGKLDVRNCIFYHPESWCDIRFTNIDYYGEHYASDITNTLFATGVQAADTTIISLSDVIMGESPRFIGDEQPAWNMENPGYYQLSEYSPCIDAGSPDTLGMNLPPIDLAGNQRIWNDIIDLGCYEFDGTLVGNTTGEITPPAGISLSSYPNPVQLSTGRSFVFLEFSLPEIPTSVPEINIYNLKGQIVRKLILDNNLTGLARKAGLQNGKEPGSQFYSKVWNCRNMQDRAVAAGVYLYTLNVDGECLAASKLLILK